MLSASSVLRFSLLVGAFGTRFVAGCAFAPNDADPGGIDAGCQTDCNDGGGGGEPTSDDASLGGGSGGKDTGVTAADARGSTIEDTGAGSAADGGSVAPSLDSGDWINMTGNPTGCDDHPGTACGYNATNNNTGYACSCYDGTQSDGWGCEPIGSCVTVGPTCTPAAGAPICVDAGPLDAGSAAGVDAAQGQAPTDAGGWIDMSTSATACDNHPGTPCGWNATNNGVGYTCLCYNGTLADGWGCEPPGYVVTSGPTCP